MRYPTDFKIVSNGRCILPLLVAAIVVKRVACDGNIYVSILTLVNICLIHDFSLSFNIGMSSCVANLKFL